MMRPSENPFARQDAATQKPICQEMALLGLVWHSIMVAASFSGANGRIISGKSASGGRIISGENGRDQPKKQAFHRKKTAVASSRNDCDQPKNDRDQSKKTGVSSQKNDRDHRKKTTVSSPKKRPWPAHYKT